MQKPLEILAHVRCQLQRFLPDTDNRALVVGVSGGRDSVVLLDLLFTLHKELLFDVLVAHVNHRLRLSSDEDENFVAGLAQAYKFEFRSIRLDPVPQGENVEAWCRRSRYRYFDELAKESSASWVLTAHHRDDHSETFLERIISGRAATDGRTLASGCLEKRILRPLLGVTRLDLDLYYEEKKLKSVIDESNSDVSFTRNRIRHQVLPYLEESLNPRAKEALAEFANRLNDDEIALAELVDSIIRHKEPEMICQREFLSSCSAALRWRVLKHLAIVEFGGDASRIGYRALKRLESAISDELPSVRRIELGFGYVCVVLREKFQFEKANPAPFSSSGLQPLGIPGEIVWPRADGVLIEIAAKIVDGKDVSSGNKSQEVVFDLDLLRAEEIAVRAWKPGDRISLPSCGRKKLKKIFREKGISVSSRLAYPVVVIGEEILWIPGITRSKLAAVTSSTTQAVKLKVSFRETTNELT